MVIVKKEPLGMSQLYMLAFPPRHTYFQTERHQGRSSRQICGNWQRKLGSPGLHMETPLLRSSNLIHFYSSIYYYHVKSIVLELECLVIVYISRDHVQPSKWFPRPHRLAFSPPSSHNRYALDTNGSLKFCTF
jgi:hypothetical protein